MAISDAHTVNAASTVAFTRRRGLSPQSDPLARVELFVTVRPAGNGSRERIVNPIHQVYTVADYENGKAASVTMTLEHDVAFVLSSDTQTNGRYEALIETRP
jgi:hypothetical protein